MEPEFLTTFWERVVYIGSLAAWMAWFHTPEERRVSGFLAIFGLNLVTQSIQTAALIAPLMRQLRPRFKIDRRRMSDLFQASSPIWVAGLLMAIHWRLELVLLRRFSTDDALGAFGASFKLLEAVRLVPWLLCMAVFPELSRRAESGDRAFDAAYPFVLKILTLLSFPAAALMFWTAPFLIGMLYPREFTDAVLPLYWLSAAVPPLFLNGLFSYGVVARGKQPLMVAAFAAAAVLQAAAASLLIPRLGAVGAAQSFLVGEMALLIFGLLATTRGLAQLRAAELLGAVAPAVLSAGVGLALRDLSPSLAGLVGAGLYSLLSWRALRLTERLRIVSLFRRPGV